MDGRSKLLLGLGIVGGVCLATLGFLLLVGLLRPFSVPSGAMSPTICPGDHVLMERFTFLSRKPLRGDLAVYRSDGNARLPAATIYVKRIAGEPGDRLRISNDKLYINNKHAALSNALGEIVYRLPAGSERMRLNIDVTVPDGQYYVLGDNSTNSNDSRFWGFVPAENIMGRIAFCFWPPKRAGAVR